MRLEGIEVGDIVEVEHRSGRRFLAFVTGPAPGGLALTPLDRKLVNRYSCRAREVITHWSKRGRPRATDEPLTPSPLQLQLDTTTAQRDSG